MNETADSPYVVDYSRTFTFSATPEQVWAVLERFESLAAGWHWLRELHIDGRGLARGTVVRGVARISFEGVDAETRAHASWTIEMTQPSMRVAARLAPRLLRWGHDRVVDATVQGLRRHLCDELV